MVNETMIYERRRFSKKQECNEEVAEEKKETKKINHMKKYKDRSANMLKDEDILEADLIKQNGEK